MQTEELMKKIMSILLCVCVCVLLIPFSFDVCADDDSDKVIFWENDPNAPKLVSWDAKARFAYTSKNSNEVYHFSDEYSGVGNIPDDQWEWMKKVTFYIDIEADSAPTIKLMDGWWSLTWTPGEVTVGELMTDNEDGTYTLKVNLVDDPLTSTVSLDDGTTGLDMDLKDFVVLSTGVEMKPIRMYFKNYQITEGDNRSIEVSKGEDVLFVSDGLFSEFLYVEVDGNKVDNTDYDAAEGSTEVTLHSSYLDTLSTGTHTLSFAFMNGHADTEFTIVRPQPQAPEHTSDNHSQHEILNTGVN